MNEDPSDALIRALQEEMTLLKLQLADRQQQQQQQPLSSMSPRYAAFRLGPRTSHGRGFGAWQRPLAKRPRGGLAGFSYLP